MDRNHNYYILKPKKKTFWEQTLSFISVPFKLPSWVISVLVARYVTHIVLNPSSIPEQRSIHLTKLSEDIKDDIVIINFKQKPKAKWFNDFLLKFTHLFSFIPFISPQLRNKLYYNKPSDMQHVDKILAELDKLIAGTSKQKYCEGRTFDWSHIHLKGMEFLDAKMRVYVYEQLDKKYGSKSYNSEHSTHIEFFTVKTSDKSELDSVEVIGPNEESKPISERKFVITCLARDQNYVNWIKDLKYTATHLGATAISFNYRGVDLSRGIVWTEEDMVDDVLAQTERLIELGAKPENICLDGMCLAGSIATLSAARLHSQNIKVKLNNERSFRSLPRLLFGYIAPEVQTANWWNPITYLRFFVASLVYAIFTPILWLGGWYTNAEDAWNKIPAKDKIYSVVRDDKNKKYDGVINDHFSSIASLIDEQLDGITEKLHNGLNLTPQELSLLVEYSEREQFNFKPSDAIVASEKFRGAHFVSRRELVAELGHQEPYTNHDYFLNKLKEKFTLEKLLEHSKFNKKQASDEEPISSVPEKPLILACSGGAGHISAAKGIINELQLKNPNTVIPLHEAVLYKNHVATFTGLFIRLGVWVGAVPILGHLVNAIAHLVGAPSMPDYKIFWNQMAKIQQAELGAKDGVERGIRRPYVDVLLDLYSAGYEYTAYNNAAHLSLTAKDTTTMSTYKGSVEDYNHYSVFKNVLRYLISAAQKGKPYTQVISTQALSLKSICDAVSHYNNSFLPRHNATHGTSYPAINIAQYMTDLPSLGCAHFMDNLENLSLEHRQLIELHVVYMSEPLKAAYFGANHGFKAVHDVDPKQNPMVRAAFKEKSLNTYTDINRSHVLTYKDYAKDSTTGFATSSVYKKIEIKAGVKVASIMIGSLAANASVDYVEHLLKAGYEHIFVFGGSNDEIAHRLDKLISTYPVEEQAKINQKIIRLGNQSDVEMAPIFTRSNCVVIRGGGLSVMEQMAMPYTPDKVILMHHEDSDTGDLTSGLSWEDCNTDRLIEYLNEKEVFAEKTSPQLCKKALETAQKFYAKASDRLEQNTEKLKAIAAEKPHTEKLIKPKASGVLSAPRQHGFFSKTTSTEEAFLIPEPDLLSTSQSACAA